MHNATPEIIEDAVAQELSEQLADVFRNTEATSVLADDVFLDGHPPFWRFQLEGRDVFDDWIKNAMPHGSDITVVRAVPTVSGFVAEFAGCHSHDGEEITDRKIVLADVRDAQITALTIYCSGDWDSELRSRHAAETTLLRP